MGWGKAVVVTAVVAALLAGGGQPAWAQQAGRRPSPAPVAPPSVPPGTFDQAKEQSELAAAQAARAAGNAGQARPLAEAAIGHWPGDAGAWGELAADCQALKDDTCRQRAAFFQAKVDYVNSLPARVAVLGFQNLAEEPVGTSTTGIVYDQQVIDTARLLWAFYNTRDAMLAQREAPPEPSFADEYPLVPMTLVVGVVAGLLTGAKSLANK
jgi:hypothetical protein